MIKYAKQIKDNGECMILLGDDAEWALLQGYSLKDVEQSDVDFNWYLTEKCPRKTRQEKELEEKERIAKLKRTKREVFLGLYQAKGITPEQIKGLIKKPTDLIEFEYANDYFRGNPLIDAIGGILGLTPKQLDKFFETNDYTSLL
jgi:hypothetical protein